MSKNYSDSNLIKSLQIYKHFLIWQIFLFFFLQKMQTTCAYQPQIVRLKKNITMLLLTVA